MQPVPLGGKPASFNAHFCPKNAGEKDLLDSPSFELSKCGVELDPVGWTIVNLFVPSAPFLHGKDSKGLHAWSTTTWNLRLLRDSESNRFERIVNRECRGKEPVGQGERQLPGSINP